MGFCPAARRRGRMEPSLCDATMHSLLIYLSPLLPPSSTCVAAYGGRWRRLMNAALSCPFSADQFGQPKWRCLLLLLEYFSFTTSRQTLNRISFDTFDYVVEHIEIVRTVCYSATYFHLKSLDCTVVLQSLNTFLLFSAAQSQGGGHDVRPGISAQCQRVCRFLQGQKNVSIAQDTNSLLYEIFPFFPPIFSQYIIYFGDSGFTKKNLNVNLNMITNCVDNVMGFK